MIGKIIRMNRPRRRPISSRARKSRFKRLRDSVFALARYIVDADPYGLLADVGRDIVSLSDYAVAVEAAGVEPGEKVEAFGVRNLVGEDLAGWQIQMLAVAARAPKMKSPLVHIILSLQQHEVWTQEEREEAITIILQVLRLERCQVIWAEHSNTSNAHLHLSIVRVDPETGLAAGTDWLIDDLHQALALIEERQGRGREPGALYVAQGGAVYDADTQIMVRDAAGTYISGWYKPLGRKHDCIPTRMRPKRASIIAAADEARSWSELHESFQELGVTYDRSGSGARISFKSESATASEVHMSLSRSKLEERLGAFEPDLSRLDCDFEAYSHSFQKQLENLRRRREEERRRLSQRVAATIASLRGAAPPEFLRELTMEAKAADESLAAAFKEAITRCTRHRLNEKTWIEAGRPTAPPPLITPCLLLPSDLDGKEGPSDGPLHLDRNELEWATEYVSDGTRLFTDHRIVIQVHAVDRPDGIDEALRIAAARWGSVTAKGPEEYLRLVSARAAALGIEVRDEQGQPLKLAEQGHEISDAPAVAATESAASSNDWKAPDPEEDPMRQQRTAAAINFFRDFDGLLLRRREMPSDTRESGRTGPLEVVLNDDPFDSRNALLTQHAMFDDNPAVQKFLQDKRRSFLEGCRSSFLGSSLHLLSMSPSDMLNALPNKSEARRPAAIAFDDYDYMEMLRDVREQLLAKKRQPRSVLDHADKTPRFERSIVRVREPVEQECSPGSSIDNQYEHLKRQRDGRV